MSKLVLLVGAAVVIAGCASKPAPVPAKSAPVTKSEPQFDASKTNANLSKISIQGFRRFNDAMSHSRFDEYGDAAAKEASNVVAEMPEGYVLQIVGHAGKYPSMRKEYVETLSAMRAKYVFHYFLRKGIPENKLEYIGVGDSEPDPDTERNAAGSVSFRIVPKKK